MEILGVTGHRPEKLGGYEQPAVDCRRIFAKTILQKYNPEFVITGMAMGFDQAVAQAAIELEIPFWAYIPFVGQQTMWTRPCQKTYKNLLEQAAKVEVICTGGYDNWKFLRRDQRIVQDCRRLSALWDGQRRGGTWRTVTFAEQMGRVYENCWEEWIAFQKQTHQTLRGL